MISFSAIEKFRASLRGPSFCPGEAGYDEARTVWNGAIDKRPALIARCAGVSDIIHCASTASGSEASQYIAIRYNKGDGIARWKPFWQFA